MACLSTAEMLLAYTERASRVAPEVVVALEAFISQAALPKNAKGDDRDEYVKEKLACTGEVASEPTTAQPAFGWLRNGLAEYDGKFEFSPLPLNLLAYTRSEAPSPKECALLLDAALQMCSRCRVSMGATESFDGLFDGLRASVVSLSERYASKRADELVKSFSSTLRKGSASRKPLNSKHLKRMPFAL